MKHIAQTLLALATATLTSAYSAQADDSVGSETQCLIDNVFHEARGEPLKGRILVASVTLSRVKHTSYPNTICGVVYQPSQFSWTKMSKKELARRVARDAKTYQTITEYVLKWQKHNTVPITDVVHYARHEVNNYWTKEMQPVTQVGAHVFYAHNL